MNAWRNRWLGMLGGLIISAPLPAAESRVLEIPTCAGQTVRINVSGKNAPAPGGDDHECCRKGCHAGSDRRKKAGLLADGCCG